MAAAPRSSPLPPATDGIGLAVAVGLLLAWAGSLGLLLRWEPAGWQWALVLPAVALCTWLSTGLFITAHDAMHGSIAPSRPRLGRALGRLALTLYAGFSFDRLLAAHRRHHAAPATAADPDFHDGRHPGFWAWYGTFLWRYLDWRQVLGMALVFNLLHHGLGVGLLQLNAFWVLPALLSTLQLFAFGTWLPHREPPEGHVEPHRAQDSGYSEVWSLLSCFHFGYHLAHHRWPGVPWWRLPQARRMGEDVPA